MDELVERCYLGLDAATLRDEVLRRLRRLVPIDAGFFATVDPATLLMTSVLADEPLGAATTLFLENEFGQEDVNKFTALAASRDPVSSLDRATRGDRRTSVRYSAVMAPLDLGDELRAALVSRGRCWGVMCLHRQDSLSGFTADELALVRRLAPHIAEGLRRALLLSSMSMVDPTAAGPGVLMLDDDLSVTSMNEQAERWLAELGDPGAGPGDELPVPVYVAASAARRSAQAPSSVIRLRTSGGTWLTVYASPMHGSGGSSTTLVLEPARPLQVASLFLDAHGLTPAQTRVASLVLRGRSTRQIVNELGISAHTIQEHLGDVFERFGIGSRRELVAVLLGGGK